MQLIALMSLHNISFSFAVSAVSFSIFATIVNWPFANFAFRIWLITPVLIRGPSIMSVATKVCNDSSVIVGPVY